MGCGLEGGDLIMITCNRIETGACSGCNVLTLLWKRAQTKQEVEGAAQSLKSELCPTGSGGPDTGEQAVVYNYRPDADAKSLSSIW